MIRGHVEKAKCFNSGNFGKKWPKSNQNSNTYLFSKMAGRGECLCRRGYVFWPLNGECYKAFTSGPCRNGQFLVPHDEDENIGKCVVNPCPRAHLYFPGDDFDSQIKCHKVRKYAIAFVIW